VKPAAAEQQRDEKQRRVNGGGRCAGGGVHHHRRWHVGGVFVASRTHVTRCALAVVALEIGGAVARVPDTCAVGRG
jgi:hypothetical protein